VDEIGRERDIQDRPAVVEPLRRVRRGVSFRILEREEGKWQDAPLLGSREMLVGTGTPNDEGNDCCRSGMSWTDDGAVHGEDGPYG